MHFAPRLLYRGSAVTPILNQVIFAVTKKYKRQYEEKIMKKDYVTPLCEILALKCDVIRTSALPSGIGNNDDFDGDIYDPANAAY